MKYNNNPAKPLEKAEILPFVQQFWIWADRMKGMLYYVQDYIKKVARSRRMYIHQAVGVLHTKSCPTAVILHV